MLPRHNKQRDLFETDQSTQAIPSSLRREIVHLIEDLLAEAVGAERIGGSGNKGGCS